jgi:hypothetical protein
MMTGRAIPPNRFSTDQPSDHNVSISFWKDALQDLGSFRTCNIIRRDTYKATCSQES